MSLAFDQACDSEGDRGREAVEGWAREGYSLAMELARPIPPPALGAVLYPPDRPPEALLAAFADELARRGFRLGGLVQHTQWGEEGCKCAMVVRELDTGREVGISQALGKGSGSCSLDPAALADASGAARRAIADRAELVFFNKFSKAEKAGRGLAAEMLSCMAAGLPMLTAVPAVLVEEWTEFCGGRAVLLPPTLEALWRWWGPERLYDDLARGVAEDPALRVVVGLNWTMVEGPHGVGLAQTPDRGTPGCLATPEAGLRAGRTLRELAELVHSWNPFEAAVGVAACNAHYNRFDLAAEPVNGLDALQGAEHPVVIGGFPGIAQRIPGIRVVERRPGPGQYPEEAAQWLLPAADAVLITSSTLANRSLPRLLSLARHARVALVGPGAPLTDRLFAYGVEASSGLVAEDVAGLARCVAEGGGARDLKSFCRTATLRKPA